MSRETEPRKISEVQPGDVLVYPARSNKRLGHALIVVDVARRGSSSMVTRVPFGCRSSISGRMS